MQENTDRQFNKIEKSLGSVVSVMKYKKTDNIYKTKTDIYQKTFTNRIKNDMICINRFTKRINFILRFIALYFIE